MLPVNSEELSQHITTYLFTLYRILASFLGYLPSLNTIIKIKHLLREVSHPKIDLLDVYISASSRIHILSHSIVFCDTPPSPSLIFKYLPIEYSSVWQAFQRI